MHKVLLAAFIATTTTACWSDVTFKPMRQVPETAQGKRVRDLKSEIRGEAPQAKHPKKTPASH